MVEDIAERFKKSILLRIDQQIEFLRDRKQTRHNMKLVLQIGQVIVDSCQYGQMLDKVLYRSRISVKHFQRVLVNEIVSFVNALFMFKCAMLNLLSLFLAACHCV